MKAERTLNNGLKMTVYLADNLAYFYVILSHKHVNHEGIVEAMPENKTLEQIADDVESWYNEQYS